MLLHKMDDKFDKTMKSKKWKKEEEKKKKILEKKIGINVLSYSYLIKKIYGIIFFILFIEISIKEIFHVKVLVGKIEQNLLDWIDFPLFLLFFRSQITSYTNFLILF